MLGLTSPTPDSFFSLLNLYGKEGTHIFLLKNHILKKYLISSPGEKEREYNCI
jgi:hypothetical protein